MTSPNEPGRLTLHYGSGESWTTAVHLRRAAGDSTTVWDANHGAHRRLGSIRPTDFYLWVESGMSSYPLDSHRTSATTAGYLIDVHLHPSISGLQSKLFDVAFVAQRDYVPALAEHHPNVRWLPLAAPRSFLHLPRRNRYDVAFVGSTEGWPARTKMLDFLAQQFRMNEWWRFHSVDEMGEVYSQSRIILNIPAASDLNMRFFEAMGAGAALLQPPIDNGVGVIATAGEHYIESDAFADPERLAVEIATLLKANRPERVGEAARDLVHKGHTYEHRLATVEAVLQNTPVKAAPIRGFSRSERRRHWIALSRATGDVGLLKHLLRGFPEAALWHPTDFGGALFRAYRRATTARRTNVS